ncbi:MAG: hypothetical protein JXP48_06655 [Acidobacteria bacterium]|nr:hypothetical protein [Acidobacteriota bacterium]
MAEVAGLFLLLLVIYLSDCIVWTRSGDWIFRGSPWRPWKIRHTPQFMMGDRGGITLAGLLPPLSPCILLAASANGRQDDHADPSRAGAPSFDMKALENRIAAFHKESLVPRILGNFLFIIIFIALPATLWTGTLAVHWRLLAALLACFWLSGVVTFPLAHRRLFPDEKSSRVKKTLLMSVSPLSAIRAADQLARDLLRGFHPIAVCSHLCSQDDFEYHARMASFDEVQKAEGRLPPPSPSRPKSRIRVEQYPITQFLDSLGCLERIRTPPIAEDGSSHSYCPRCHCQYRAGFQTCADCGGIGLLPLADC